MKNQASLFLSLRADQFPLFFPLLQQGFALRTHVGCTIGTMLCKNWGIAPEYVEDQIKTIFLDGKPVDDIHSAIVRDGSALALSAAMPGLVGSTFRRGSHLAAFRDTITYRNEAVRESSDQEGIVILKLFNLMVRELGPAFLEKGIWIKQNELRDILGRQRDDLRAGCKSAQKDGKETDPDKLSDLSWGGSEFVLLKVFEV